MGIPQLWQKLGEGDVVDIATYASQHFEEHQRPLRIAVDEAIWRYKFFVSKEKVTEIRIRQPAARPNEKSFLWRILQLQRLNCQLVFVTDGPQRPNKRGKAVYGYNDYALADLKTMIGELGCVWHRAPGEAEAECVQMQRLGLVDVVWTEDADALMFGASTVFRFKYKESEKGNKKKDNLKVEVHRSQDVFTKLGLTREGMVLFAVLVGADYDKQGLFNVGASQAIQAANGGLGELLCQASDDKTLPAWRERLQGSLGKAGSRVVVPVAFPDPDVVRNYYRPIVSSEETLRNLRRSWWTSGFNDETLRPMLAHCYNLWIEDYIELIVPILLVRSLAQTTPGQEASNKCYQIERIGKNGPSQSKIRYTLSTITPLDIRAEYDYEYRKKPQNRCKDIPPEERPLGEGILDCILRHAVPDVMENVVSAGSRKTADPELPSRKRALPRDETNKEGSSSKLAKKVKPATEAPSTKINKRSTSESAPKPKPKLTSKPSAKTDLSESANRASHTANPQSQERLEPRKTLTVATVIDLVSDDEDESQFSFLAAKSFPVNKSEAVRIQAEKQPLDPTSPNSLRLTRHHHFETKLNAVTQAPAPSKTPKPTASGFIFHSFDSDDDD